MSAPPERFELALSTGPARKQYARALGDAAASYPWHTLEASRYPAELVRRARAGWTENAFNEHCTAVALGQLVHAFGLARVPLDLWGVVTTFAPHEVLHTELCARFASALGGAAPRAFDPPALELATDPSLTPLQRANELAVRVLCVGEALSFPLLRGARNSATHPLTRAVLETIVRDEAHHGRAGFHYLHWVEPELTRAERDRLGHVATRAVAPFLELFESLARSSARDGVTSEGFLLAHVHELGWMEASAYRALAFRELERSVRAPLARYGVRVRT